MECAPNCSASDTKMHRVEIEAQQRVIASIEAGASASCSVIALIRFCAADCRRAGNVRVNRVVVGLRAGQCAPLARTDVRAACAARGRRFCAQS